MIRVVILLYSISSICQNYYTCCSIAELLFSELLEPVFMIEFLRLYVTCMQFADPKAEVGVTELKV